MRLTRSRACAGSSSIWRCGAIGAAGSRTTSRQRQSLKRNWKPLRSLRKVLFELPASWAWVNVGVRRRGSSRQDARQSQEQGDSATLPQKHQCEMVRFRFVRLFFEMRFEDSELAEFALRAGDVLICEGGEPGRAGVWDERENDIYFQKAIHRARFCDLVDGRYFVKALNSPWCKSLPLRS